MENPVPIENPQMTWMGSIFTTSPNWMTTQQRQQKSYTLVHYKEIYYFVYSVFR